VAVVAGAVAFAALAGSTGGQAATAAKKPIIIGWAFDSKGQMAPFDNPALAAAKIRVAQINAKGGVGGRKFQIKTCDTQNNNPARAKSCAASLLGGGASIMFTTCDVDFATPVVQESINRGVLAVAPCIGTDQMGPKRFGKKGKLAFSFGNVAQDEGSAMAEYAYRRGWRNASIATNTLLVYFKNVTAAFQKRFTQLGGKIVTRESYATGANNVNTAVSRLNAKKADVVVTATAFGELPALVSGLRALGNKTPILNSWAGDGTYWVTSNPQVTDYYCVTYASVFGDDPNKDVKAMIASLKKAGAPPFTGGFVGGAAAVDGVFTAIKQAKGSTKGSVLAAKIEKFKKVQTLGGKISFSPQLHTVFGRQYRVIKIQNNKATYVGAVTAKVVPKL
jgi:branched-chain amino acid transport system substrate-binding protein